MKDSTMKTPWNSLLAGTSFAIFAASTQAQMHSPMVDHSEMSAMHSSNPARMEARLNRHLNTLKRKLHLTPTQEAAWTNFAAAMKPPMTALMPFPDRREMDKLSTPERIEKMKQLRAQHQETMKPFMDQRDEAIKTFYAALDAQQKKTFDAAHADMRHSPMHY